MALDNLRDFLRALDARGELVHVGRPVSVDKEITEIADRCMKSPGGGPAPCQETVIREQDVDLAQFPVPVCWPEDGGPYITLPGVITRDPKTGVRNVGMYRIQVIGRRELAMHWQRHKVGAAHWREMAERGEKMPV